MEQVDERQPQGKTDNAGKYDVGSSEVTCRLCANRNDKVIGIYSAEGILNDLANKMNSYLPVKVSEDDTLPLHCCWSCASTVLAWHELVVVSVEADRRLRQLQEEAAVKTAADEDEDDFDANVNLSDTGQLEQNLGETKTETDSAATSLTTFQHTSASSASHEVNSVITDDAKAPSRRYRTRRKVKADYLSKDVKKWIKSPDIVQSFEDCSDETDDNQTTKNNETPVREYKSDENILEIDEDDKDFFHLQCQFCSNIYLHDEDIENHVKEAHPGKKLTLPDLNEVKLEVNSKKEKRKHTRIDQEVVNAAKVRVGGRVYYNCKICGKSLHSPYTYIWHMRIHTGERPFVCDLCGKQFRVSQGLVRHLRETHEGIKNFPCDLCGRMFATRRNVEEHRRIHTNERPYICDLCGKAFKQKASLFVHSRSHSDSFPFRCSYCNQGFRTKPPLMIHITRHTGEKPYPCDICGRCFRIKYELKRHRLIHSDEKPFSCTECGMSFRQKRYLRNHDKINHNRTTP